MKYQVVITDEAIIGKDIVTIEEPEKEKEPPAIGPAKQEPKQPEIIVQKKTIVHQSPKTGDTKNLIVLILLCILSCAVILTCGRIARKTK